MATAFMVVVRQIVNGNLYNLPSTSGLLPSVVYSISTLFVSQVKMMSVEVFSNGFPARDVITGVGTSFFHKAYTHTVGLIPLIPTVDLIKFDTVTTSPAIYILSAISLYGYAAQPRKEYPGREKLLTGKANSSSYLGNIEGILPLPPFAEKITQHSIPCQTAYNVISPPSGTMLFIRAAASIYPPLRTTTFPPGDKAQP